MPSRLNDCEYLDLGPTAQACLANLYMLAIGSGETEVRGRPANFASWFGWRPNWIADSFRKLEDAGFIATTKDDAGYVTVSIVGAEKLPQVGVKSESSQSEVRAKSESSRSQVRYESESSQSQVGVKSEYKESSIHAGFGDDALYIDREENRYRQDKSNYPPNPPRGNDAIDAPVTKQKKKPKAEASESFATFWGQYPKRVGYGNAVKAWQKAIDESGLSEDALLRQVLDGLARWAASEQWASGYIQHPTTWLHGSMWRDDPPPPKPKQETYTQPEQREYKPYDWREQDAINEEKERQENERRRKAKQEYDEMMARLKAEREQEEAKSAGHGWDDDEIPDF